jgi:dihydrofolate reductase
MSSQAKTSLYGMELTITTFVTLDGVMQAPGGPEEDRSGGFEHGGWSYPFGDEAFGAFMTGVFEEVDAFLLGRRTYEIFAGHWPRVDDPDNVVASKLNRLPKYVASTTLRELSWEGAQLLEGDTVAAVRSLKAQPGRELQVHGSGDLAQTLIRHGLVDLYRVLVFPVVVGSGKRLFGDGAVPASLRLESTSTTPAGVTINTYRPAGPLQTGSYAIDG